jgi:YYY domain-containing protein
MTSGTLQDAADYTPAPPRAVGRKPHLRSDSRGPWLPVAIEAVLLLAIMALAVWLRFRGIKWGTGYFLHPDELFMTSVLINISAPSGVREYFDSATSPLNPFNYGTGFVYGTFPLFMAKLVGSFTTYSDVSNAHIPGRWLSAIADSGTVLLVWWIGRMLWNRWTGLLAALLMACTVLHIGASHYFTADAWSAFFAVGSFAFTLAGWKYQRWLCYAVAGLMVGFAAASKPTMIASFGFLALPLLETVRLYGWRGLVTVWFSRDEPEVDDGRSFPVVLATALALFIALWTIRIAQPYTFTGPSIFSFRIDERWANDVDYWRNVQSGEFDYPPGIQWADRAPIWFSVKNMVLWGMGPGLGIAALAGFAWQGWSMLARRTWPTWTLLIPMGWIAFHLVYFGAALSKTARYLMPAYPFLVLLAAAVIMALGRWAWRNGRVRNPLNDRTWRIPRYLNPALIVPAIAIVTTVLYGIAFTTVYIEPQTRAVASDWIVENVPDGSTITNEYWDLGLPVSVPGRYEHEWNLLSIHPYADETPAKVTEMVSVLNRSDYIVLSSNRLIGTIPRMPWRYPIATRYYEALLSGELGFEQVAHFTQYPELFGISIDDRSAEEALTVYDHPEVMIFRKTDRFEYHEAWYMFNDALGHGGLSVRPVQTQPPAMMLDGEGQHELRTSDSWRSLFDPDSLTNRWPLIAWYLAFQVLVLPAAPILWQVCPWLPDRGYALSKTLGIVGLGWLAWWLGSLRLIECGVPAIALCWLVIFATSLAIVWRNMARISDDLGALKGRILGTELLFGGSYLLAAWIRAQNPDFWIPDRAGSQLQNLGAFTAAALTPAFPVYDPWLSDGVIHDFTFGYVPWAAVTRISGIVPEVGYSLTLVTLAALVVVNAWQAGSVLVSRLVPGASSWVAPVAGLLAPLAVIGIGSWRMVQRIGAADWGPNYDGSVLDALNGLRPAVTGSPEIAPDAWHATQAFVGPGTIEFPLLSYLTGDLAIQQLGMPLFLAAFALIIGFTTRTSTVRVGRYRILDGLGGVRDGLLGLVLIGLVAGWTIATNPLFGGVILGFAGLLALLSSGARDAWASSWAMTRDAGIAFAITAGVAIVAVLPFLRSYGYFATIRAPIAEPLNAPEWLGHFGPVVMLVVSYLFWQLWRGCRYAQEEGAIGWLGAIALFVLALLGLALAWLLGSVTLMLLLLMLPVGFLLWYRHDDLRHLPILAAIVIGIGCALVANTTTFETWTPQQNLPLQLSLAAWMLFGVLAAPITVAVIAMAWERGHWYQIIVRNLAAAGWTAVAALLLAAGLAYPIVALPQRADDRLVQTNPTFDTTAFMETAGNTEGVPLALEGDLAAVDWMRANLFGRPTILEAPANVPGLGGRISALTGYPTVIGVTGVELQQRPGMDRLVNWRNADVSALYGTSLDFEDIEPILQDYGVQVIYVGSLERSMYGERIVTVLDAAVASGDLERLYDADGVTIYAYNGSRVSREYQS